MAKRKRLTPAVITPTLETKSAAPSARIPIAQIAGDASGAAAFEEVRAELEAASREGRLIKAIPLPQIKADYLIRDRVASDAEDMEALCQSLTSRGQQTPIEVVMLADGYGLISGWRRVQALQRLHAETGADRFATVQALIRQPDVQRDAYVAMVEENEIRADLSFYERARVVWQTLRAGVFETEKQALQSLFANVSYAKRSKIKSFIPLVQALDDVLDHPALIPEKLGLALSRRISQEDGFGAALADRLRQGETANSADERALLEHALKPPVSEPAGTEQPALEADEIAPGIRVKTSANRMELIGPGLTPARMSQIVKAIKASL